MSRLQWWVDSVITVVVKSPDMSQSGRQGRLGTVLATAVIGGEGSNGFPGSIVMIQQTKKVPESQTLQEETDKHSVLCMSLKAGIWRMR